MILCPKCSTPLGEVGPTGRLESVCSRCRFKFESIKGRVLERSSAQIQDHRTGLMLNRRDYEVSIELGDRTIEVLSFRSPDRKDRIQVHRGDMVSVTHLIDGTRREELLEIFNYTTGTGYRLGEPGTKSARDAGITAAIIASFAGALLVALGIRGRVVLLPMVVVLVASWYLMKRRLLPTQTLAPEDHAALAASQSQLATKAQLVSLRASARREADERLGVRNRLDTLRQKMLKVGIEAYTHRIATIQRGLSIIDQQLDVDRQLLDGYDKSIMMMEIEHESAAAAELMPSGVNALIQEKVAELDALRAQQQNLTRDLNANAEVEAFLRLGSSP